MWLCKDGIKKDQYFTELTTTVDWVTWAGLKYSLLNAFIVEGKV